jgi:hypothetical protein
MVSSASVRADRAALATSSAELLGLCALNTGAFRPKHVEPAERADLTAFSGAGQELRPLDHVQPVVFV